MTWIFTLFPITLIGRRSSYHLQLERRANLTNLGLLNIIYYISMIVRVGIGKGNFTTNGNSAKFGLSYS